MTVNFIWQSYLHLLCFLKNAHGSGELSEYEKKRLENIRQNSEFFDGLQLTEVMTLLLCHFAFAYTHIFIFLYIYIYIYIWGILSHQKCRATFTDYTSKYQGISHFSKEEWQYQYIRADWIIKCILIVCGRLGALIFTVLESCLRSPSHCVVFLDKIYSHSASLHPRI